MGCLPPDRSVPPSATTQHTEGSHSISVPVRIPGELHHTRLLDKILFMAHETTVLLLSVCIAPHITEGHPHHSALGEQPGLALLLSHWLEKKSRRETLLGDGSKIFPVSKKQKMNMPGKEELNTLLSELGFQHLSEMGFSLWAGSPWAEETPTP